MTQDGKKTASRSGRTRHVAASDEVLCFLTAVLRGDEDAQSKNASVRMRAAELLGKRLGIFDEDARGDGEGVVIVDDVRPGNDAN